MNKLYALWSALPQETRDQLKQYYPWLIAAAIGAFLACYLGLCSCQTAKGSSPASCPCTASCSCGCQQGLPCGPHCDWPGRPKTLPAVPKGDSIEADINFGVDMDRVGNGSKYHRRGKPVSRSEVIQALEKAVPDDASKLRLTVIGPKESREPVLKDLASHAALAPLKDRYVVQGYEPDNWAIKDYGFKLDGKPTIYLQLPDGKVLHRQDSYEGPEKLAEAIRKADPSYKPDTDPNLNRPALPLPGVLGKIPLIAWVLGGLGVLLLLSSHQGEQK